MLGRGSTKNPTREQELYRSGDLQYAHFGSPLHVRIDARAVPALAYERMTGAMHALAELLVPVNYNFKLAAVNHLSFRASITLLRQLHSPSIPATP